MPVENGVDWRPIDPLKRGRHKTFAAAVSAAMADFRTERDEFFDRVCAFWPRLCGDIPARPGRFESGCIYLYVGKATTSFLVRSRLPMIRKRLAALPGAPKTVSLRVEIHSS